MAGNTAWFASVMRARSGTGLVAGAYGLETPFVFVGPTANFEYAMRLPLVDKNNVEPGDPCYLQVRRNKASALDTNAANATLVTVTLKIPIRRDRSP